MHDEAVKAVEGLTIKSMELKEVGKEFYSPVKLNRVYSDPRPNSIGIKSLTGVLDFLEFNIDKLSIDDLMLHIVDHTDVKIVTNVHGKQNERHTVLNASLDDFDVFQFDRYIEQEQFIIKMRSMFNSTEDLETIIRYTSKIDRAASVTTEDDGITQNVNIKQGQSGVRTEREIVPSLVLLEPYRTFPEAEQPASQFLFRMKTENETVKCALFQADGGTWRNQARINIKNFFIDNNIPIPVIA